MKNIPWRTPKFPMNAITSFLERRLACSLPLLLLLAGFGCLNPAEVIAQSPPPASLTQSILAEKWEMQSQRKVGERIVEFRRGRGATLERLEIKLRASSDGSRVSLGYTQAGRYASITFPPADAPKVSAIFDKWKEWAKTAEDNKVKDVQEELATYAFDGSTYEFTFFVKTTEMFDEENRVAQLLKERPMNIVTAPSFYFERRNATDDKAAAPAFQSLSTAAVETSLFLLSQVATVAEEGKEAGASKKQTESLFK